MFIHVRFYHKKVAWKDLLNLYGLTVPFTTTKTKSEQSIDRHYSKLQL